MRFDSVNNAPLGPPLWILRRVDGQPLTGDVAYAVTNDLAEAQRVAEDLYDHTSTPVRVAVERYDLTQRRCYTVEPGDDADEHVIEPDPTGALFDQLREET